LWLPGTREKQGSLMARLPPIYHSGQTEHIIQRGNNREVIFAGDDHYKEAILPIPKR
jgi:hypothetical protein